MLILPIGHEDTTVRRLPWVTFTIMGLCLVVFIATLPGRNARLAKAGILLRQAVDYYMEHPWLEPDPRLARLLSSGDAETDAALGEVLSQFSREQRPASGQEIARQQEALNALVERAFAELERLPSRRLGLVPAHPRPLAWLTHMFMHGGWLHLLGNLLILFLTGPFLEDAWGRPLYGGFYLASGIVAAAMFVVRYPHMEGPLIGASGAIAGVMGAFLVRFWNRRMRFFYWFGLVFRGTFTAPAWLMLGLWFLQQLTFAQAMDVVAPGGSGVAYWAHVWGFVFGAVVALGIKRFEVEERFIHPAIESKITLVDNAPLDRAIETFRSGDRQRGFRMLEELVRREPRNVDAALALWGFALEEHRAGGHAGTAQRLVRELLAAGDAEGALRIWEELREFAPEAPVGPALVLGVARAYEEAGRTGEAGEVLWLLASRPPAELPPGILVKAARLALRHGLPVAKHLARAAAEHPEVEESLSRELVEAEAGLEEEEPPGEAAPPIEGGEVPESPGAPGGEPPAVPPSPPGPKRLKLLEAVPVRFEPDGLVIRLGEKLQRVRSELVRVLAAGGVPTPSGRPTVVVDLLLDAPWDDVAEVRTIRLWANRFDPRTLAAGETPLAAMQGLLDEILRWSGAVPLPDPEAARGRPFQTFPSLEEYEREVLGVEGT